MDFQIFAVINQIATENAFLDAVGIFLARYLIWLLFVFIIILTILPLGKEKKILLKMNALRSILGALIGGSFALIIGQFISRARPFVAGEANLLITPPITAMSFPSLHTTVAFALACTLFLFNSSRNMRGKKIGIYFLVAAILIGLSRIYVGVHYPSDILFGAMLGCLSSLIIRFFIPSVKLGRARI